MPKRLTRVLIVANRTATSPALLAELQDCADGGPVIFRLLVPALNSRLRDWLSDTDEAWSTALTYAEHAQSVMTKHGLSVDIEIGDSVPLVAIADALERFPAEELIISTPPATRCHRLERDLCRRARQQFDLPVLHVVTAAKDCPPPLDRPSLLEDARRPGHVQRMGRLRSARRPA